jgi:transcriptional regulator
MYIPPYFKIEDPEAIEKIVSESGFATLITPSSDGIKATHLPLLYEPASSSKDAGIINGHMARANDHRRSIDGASESLAIFQGPDAYISSEWYETAPAVPTWNFAIVHMRGPLKLIDDR